MGKRDVSDVVLETIDYIVKQNMKNYIGNFVKSVVKAVKNGKYTVSINGADYDLICGVGVSLKAGDTVLVHIPNNQFKDAYICALLKSCKVSGTSSGNAKPSDVREGKTFSSAELENATGTLKESTLEVKEDGEYTPDEGELYSKVIVSTGGKGGNLVTKTITKNGTYSAKDDSVDGYSSVMVNVEDNLIEKTVTENGTYDPKDDKATGYSKIIVNVKASGGVLIADVLIADLGVPTAIIISPVLISDDIATTA